MLLLKFNSTAFWNMKQPCFAARTPKREHTSLQVTVPVCWAVLVNVASPRTLTTSLPRQPRSLHTVCAVPPAYLRRVPAVISFRVTPAPRLVWRSRLEHGRRFLSSLLAAAIASRQPWCFATASCDALRVSVVFSAAASTQHQALAQLRLRAFRLVY